MSDNNTILGLDDVEIEMFNTSLEELDSEVVNLITVGVDGSNSMDMYTNVMTNALKDFKLSLLNSKEADTLLVARADFGNDKVNLKGHKTLEQFETDYVAKGSTPLYDVIVEAGENLIQYMKFLRQNGTRVKAVFAIFSDGMDYNSKNDFSTAKKKIDELNKKEITTAFITFGDEAKGIAKQLGFQNELEVGSNASELRKAFNCLSKSVIDSSKSVIPDGDNFFKI